MGPGETLSQRQVKVGKEVRAQLSKILLMVRHREPRLEGVTVSITDVRVSRDLRHGTVYISAFGASEGALVAKILQDHRGFFQKELAQRVKLKFLPQLVFRPDLQEAYTAEVMRLLQETGASASPQDKDSDA